MKKTFSLFASVIVILAMILGFVPVQTVQAASTNIVISQVYGGGGNVGGIYTNDFVELYNLGSSTISLDGWSIQYTSATGTGNFGANSGLLTPLTGTLAPGQYFLIQESAGANVFASLPTPNLIDDSPINISGIGGKVALVNTITPLGCNGSTTPCNPTALASIVDLVGWGTANFYEGSGPAPATSNSTAVIRKLNGAQDTDNNVSDFIAGAPNPRNTPPPDAAPAILSTIPVDGASSVAYDANITVTFSEAVNLSGSWFALTCDQSGNHPAAVSGGPTTYVLNPDSDFIVGDSCTLTISKDLVTDQDLNDPPDKMAADFTLGFSTLDACQLPYTPIYSIQGSGLTVAIQGSVTTQGVVVGDYEGASPALRGFFLQDLNGDGAPTTSDGIFIFESNNANSVNLGDVIRVTGIAGENQGQSQITSNSIVNCGSGSVDPVDVTLPFASANTPEQYEGMLVRFPQTLTVTEMYQLGRFDEVLLSSNGRLKQPTNVTTPGDAALALQEQNNLNQILVDDASQVQNPDPILFGRDGQPLSASNTLRGGDTATDIVGVMTYTWGGNSASPNSYRVRPINALNGYVNFEASNPRPDGAPSLTGRLRVVGMNLLNFFNTYADGNSSTPGCFPNGTDADCRGAESQLEFDRQWTKTVAAITGTQADVIGIIEMENDGYGADSAIQFLVDRLNDSTNPGEYAFIDADTGTGQTNALGVDAIKVGLIYKTANVTPVGLTAALNTEAFVNGGDSSPRNRAALAQAFEEIGTGSRFVVTVNHLKSKGSACDDPDVFDGQGNCNIVRTNAANELTAWLASDPTGTGDPDALIIGDLNSYAMEDPITAIKNVGYTNLVYQYGGDEAYSYVFDGQWGYLDHALSNDSLTPQVTGVSDWHINSDEPSVLDYNTNFKSANQITTLYSPDEFRIADHDPVLIDLNLSNDPPAASAGGPYNANEGEVVALAATGSDPDGTAVTFAWDLNNDGTFETDGQNTNFEAIDGTIDYTVSVKVTDVTGLFMIASANIHVENIAPDLGEFIAPTDPIKVNTSVNISADFTDPGVIDTHTVSINWGDGTIAEGEISESNGSGTASGSHSYMTPGLYVISMTVTDKDGGVSNTVSSADVVIYNPNDGFVTGSGWFISPADAYKAKFDIVAKYLKGSTTPQGSTELILSKNLLFKSTHYDWLVVAGYKALFRGTGTINGAGEYFFIVTAVDDSPDTIQIKVWDANGMVIYDMTILQPIGGGNISIKK